MTTPPITWALALLAFQLPATPTQSHRSKYAGMESREIKTLSAEDVEQLRAGHGWGLSLVAELNGVPGPRHVLDMKHELELDVQQVERIEAIYEQMKDEAIPLGTELIRLERELDEAFAHGTIGDAELRRLVAAIGNVRQELRYVHLSAHLKTPGVLSQQQIDTYSRLRGYGSSDPCSSVPPGHDPEMWRKHNRCDAE